MIELLKFTLGMTIALIGSGIAVVSGFAAIDEPLYLLLVPIGIFVMALGGKILFD